MKLIRFIIGVTCVVIGIVLEKTGRVGTRLVEYGYRIDGDLE